MTNITNEELQKLIVELRKNEESALLVRVADDLEKPTRKRREINLSKINRYTDENEVIIVPGKVLGGGEIDHKVTISAFKFSGSAVEKLKKSGSKIIPINEITPQSVKGKRVRIIG